MILRLDDLRGPEIRALLEEHLADMRRISPPESVHALDLDALRRPEISFWTVWEGDALLGCGALKQLAATHGEIKSMRTAHAHRGKGVARFVLRDQRGAGVAGRSRTSSPRAGSTRASGSSPAGRSPTTYSIPTACS